MGSLANRTVLTEKEQSILMGNRSTNRAIREIGHRFQCILVNVCCECSCSPPKRIPFTDEETYVWRLCAILRSPICRDVYIYTLTIYMVVYKVCQFLIYFLSKRFSTPNFPTLHCFICTPLIESVIQYHQLVLTGSIIRRCAHNYTYSVLSRLVKTNR